MIFEFDEFLILEQFVDEQNIDSIKINIFVYVCVDIYTEPMPGERAAAFIIFEQIWFLKLKISAFLDI